MKVLRFTVIVSLCILLLGLVSSATDVTSENSSENSAASESKDAAPVIPPSFLKMLQIGGKYDDFKPQEWTAVPFPSVGDTLDPEIGGIRESLKQHGIGIMLFPSVGLDDNLTNPPMFGANGAYHGGNPTKQFSAAKPGTPQAYSGQRPTYSANQFAWLTFNRLSSGTQFVVSAYEFPTNWASGTTVEGVYVTGLYLNQYFWNKKALLTIGWGQASSWEAYGIFVHGNMAVPLIGVGAIGSAEVGQAPPMNSAPEALVRVNWTKNFYTVSEVQRSTEFWNTKADNTLMNHDALYIPFRQPGAKALYMQEFDYHRKALPGTKDLWVRVNGTLNFSHYFDFRKGGEAFALAFYDWGMTPGGPAPLTRHHFHNDTPEQQLLKNETMLGMPFNPFGKVLTENNWQVYSAVDYQLRQSKELFFRGWYGGFTASYVPPQQNVFSQYYEARVYNVGPFKSHPIDQLTIAVGLLQMSKPGAKMIAAAQAQSGLYANTYNSTQLSIAPSYTTHIHAGLWWSGGFQYCVHPTIAPKVPNPLVFRTNLTMFW